MGSVYPGGQSWLCGNVDSSRMVLGGRSSMYVYHDVMMTVVGSLGDKLGSCWVRRCSGCGDEGVGGVLSRVPWVLYNVVWSLM